MLNLKLKQIWIKKKQKERKNQINKSTTTFQIFFLFIGKRKIAAFKKNIREEHNIIQSLNKISFK